MSLTPPAKLQKLRAALHAKAKALPNQRFHALYDKVYRSDVLAHAYACCKANGGVAGVDGQTFGDIGRYGMDCWLSELAEELRVKRYRPSPVRRVWIPKPDGKQRPLGIPTIKDRVVQTAAMLVLEPIFEADLQPEQYAYRENRSALDAVNHVRKLLNGGYTQVVDADLSGYFDSIPHTELMRCLARRIVDGAMLHLLKMWLEAPVEEIDERGNKQRTTRNKDEGRGTPQGAPISPLLSNLYMRRFVLGWKTLGQEVRLQARIVNYADGPATFASVRSVMPTGRSTHTSGIGSASGGVPSTRPRSSLHAVAGVPGRRGPSGCYSSDGTPPACRMRTREPSPRAGCGKSARPVR